MIYIIVIIAALIVLGILAAASFRMDLNLYLKSYCKDESEAGRAVMISFDDGPHPVHTAEVLDILKQRGVKALFFLIGEKALENPHLVRRIVSEGHIIGIHSLTHSAEFTIYSKKRVKRDLEASKKILDEISGQNIMLFRPPFGVTNPAIGKAVKELGLISVGWSVRSFDTLYENNTEKTTKRVVKRLKHGSILLLHDRLTNSAGLLENILDYLVVNNYDAKIFKRVF
ncbi:MAG: polysaccharide deacetylase family protein [Bacteroidales bacterium]|jgi:peptidoglycan/xylan/chitin deacetylase (PgdA/CDA1 family)|nr:polysaccharide deacetylase family protein [Bacteroidales bacterium]